MPAQAVGVVLLQALHQIGEPGRDRVDLVVQRPVVATLEFCSRAISSDARTEVIVLMTSCQVSMLWKRAIVSPGRDGGHLSGDRGRCGFARALVSSPRCYNWRHLHPSKERPITLRGKLEDLTARDLMTPGVVTIVDDAPVENGMRAIAAHRTHAVLVLGAGTGAALGWATDRGLLGHLERTGRPAPVRDAITEEVLWATPGTTARALATMLLKPGAGRVLVASAAGRTPEGVVSAIDLMRAVGS